MNLLDACVVEVLGPPEQAYGRWFVPVKSDCWGQVSEYTIMKDSREEAELVKIGDTHLV